MASVVVVNNELRDSVKEYSQIIDGINKNTEFSQSISSYLEKEEISNKSELLNKVYGVSTSENFKKLTDKEFEPAFYLLLHIASELSSSQEVLDNAESPIIKVLLETDPAQPPSLRDRRSIKSATILSVLSTIFNLVPGASKTRITLLKEILRVIKTSGIDFALIQDNVSSNLIHWLKQANSDDSEIRSIFWQLINLDNQFSKKSLDLIKSFTNQYELNSGELNQLITFALSSQQVDVSFLVNNNVAQALKNEQQQLSTIFNKYVRGEIITIEEIPTELPADFIHKKSKILNLAKYFADASSSPEHDDIVFKYSEIPNVQSGVEFEQLLIEAIKAGVIEGKLNQVEESFYLSRVNRFILAGEDNSKNWIAVKAALQQWKDALTNIDEAVAGARESIVGSTAN
ncbi:uncharacterized protein J8A68_005979 [[Candida] subhashii]|uniref:Eukaryotic translation initiation factor 3 subunit M n=1 Tax=[Candida] subhashii TaxID=561895 RepID=A0A8J5USD8_9ASCO|nr:uncharacterized protein J8A68_005979 [[Candida] subhashii]KAG7660560.1 hypothetical protein J8A68_005979 [[Candida] subhashii]